VPQKLASVVLPVPVDRAFHYIVPPELRVERGVRVLVPFGRKTRTGYVVGFAAESEVEELKTILRVLDAEPPLTDDLLLLTRWMADYYFCSWGEAIRAALPAGMEVRGARAVEMIEAGRLALRRGVADDETRLILLHLSEARAADLKALGKRLGIRNLSRRVAALADKGLVRLADRVIPAAASPRTERVVRLAALAAPSAEELASRGVRSQRAGDMLAALAECREIPVAEVRREWGVSPSVLGRLEALGLIEMAEREHLRDPYSQFRVDEEPPAVLTPHQERALATMREDLERGVHRTYLLHGITGSGKTEVYLRATAHALERGKQAILLVPEISLTPRLVELLRARFPGQVAVLHSGLSAGERYDAWRRIRRGECAIAVGARSAVFAPFERLGVIVVDEEHETSYKQEELPRYHAREVAIRRAQQAGCVVILGTATPSMESFYLGSQERYVYVHLPRRIADRPLPSVEVVDMREEEEKGKGRTYFSRRLLEAIDARLSQGEQVLLFLNRRGFFTFIQCRDCGHVVSCPNCSVSLTFHSRQMKAVCHYCDYREAPPDVCPQCKGTRFFRGGAGTQRIEEEVQAHFPGARVARMDRDTTVRKLAHARILRQVRAGEVDILVGTQMVAKGLDFPNITLAGIVLADSSLNIPDFRASERTFQLVTQVAGRTGRGEVPGEVIIQTYRPQHYSILAGQHQDFVEFYEREILFRETLGYPPCSQLILVTVDAAREARVEKWCSAFAECLARLCPAGSGIEVLGPATPVVAKIKNRYRRRVLLKGVDMAGMQKVLREALSQSGGRGGAGGLRIHIDVDPIVLF